MRHLYMKVSVDMKKLMIKFGIHGKRHKKSQSFVDVKSYEGKKKIREDKLAEWCHNNGVGV